MTILKKINTLSIVLIAATIIGVGLDFGFKWYDYARGFHDGFTEDSRLEKKEATKTAEVTEAQTDAIAAEAEDIAAEAAMSEAEAVKAGTMSEAEAVKAGTMPEAEALEAGTMPEAEAVESGKVTEADAAAAMSEALEKSESVAEEKSESEAGKKDGEKRDFGGLLGIVAVLTLAIALLVAFVKLVLNYIGVLGTVKRGEIFSEDLERKTNHIGIELIIIYVAEWGLTLLLGIDVAQTPSFGVLCCGVGMMIVAQIFALGRKMKEDQEFMV